MLYNSERMGRFWRSRINTLDGRCLAIRRRTINRNVVIFRLHALPKFTKSSSAYNFVYSGFSTILVLKYIFYIKICSLARSLSLKDVFYNVEKHHKAIWKIDACFKLRLPQFQKSSKQSIFSEFLIFLKNLICTMYYIETFICKYITTNTYTHKFFFILPIVWGHMTLRLDNRFWFGGLYKDTIILLFANSWCFISMTFGNGRITLFNFSVKTILL